MAHLRAAENLNGPHKYQNVRFVTIVIQWRNISCFYSCSFSYQSTMDSRFPENWYHSGNTAHFGGVTPHTWHDKVHGNMVTLTVTGVKLQSWSIRSIIDIVRSVLTRETRWY